MVYYGFTQLDALLAMWQQFGVFSVLIPFVLVFAVVFAILQKSRILGAHRGIDTIIALAIGMLSLQWDFMPRFFSELFPRLGMSIAVLLALVILVGMFITSTTEKAYYIILASIAGIIFIVMLIQTYGGFTFSSSWFWQQWGGAIVSLIVIIGVILVFVIPKTPERQ
jgi:hypothetical protein